MKEDSTCRAPGMAPSREKALISCALNIKYMNKSVRTVDFLHAIVLRGKSWEGRRWRWGAGGGCLEWKDGEDVLVNRALFTQVASASPSLDDPILSPSFKTMTLASSCQSQVSEADAFPAAFFSLAGPWRDTAIIMVLLVGFTAPPGQAPPCCLSLSVCI